MDKLDLKDLIVKRGLNLNEISEKLKIQKEIIIDDILMSAYSETSQQITYTDYCKNIQIWLYENWGLNETKVAKYTNNYTLETNTRGTMQDIVYHYEDLESYFESLPVPILLLKLIWNDIKESRLIPFKKLYEDTVKEHLNKKQVAEKYRLYSGLIGSYLMHYNLLGRHLKYIYFKELDEMMAEGRTQGEILKKSALSEHNVLAYMIQKGYYRDALTGKSINVDTLLKDYMNGLTLGMIGKKYDIREATVRKLFKLLGITYKMIANTRNLGFVELLPEEVAVKRLVNDGECLTTLVEELNVEDYALRLYLDSLHLSPMEVLNRQYEQVIQLQAEGYSFREIRSKTKFQPIIILKALS